MNICGINYESFNDAEGISCVIFIAGCKHHCVGCHSKQTWDFNSGKPVTTAMINQIKKEIHKRPFISYLVLSGGDPVYSHKEVIQFLDALNIDLPIWLYTGFTFDELRKNYNDLLNRCSVVVDGPFDCNKRDITLPFRGSINQHIYKKINDDWIMSDEF